MNKNSFCSEMYSNHKFNTLGPLCVLKSVKLSLFSLYCFFENIVLSISEIFISGTETMICHLKRQGKEVGVWDGNNKLTVSLTLFLLSKSLTYFLKFLLSKWYIKFLPQFRTFASSSRCVVAKLRDMSNVHPALHVYKFEIGLFPHNLCSLLGLKRACANLNTFCNSGWVGGTLMPGDRNLKTGFDNLFIYFVKENPMVAC